MTHRDLQNLPIPFDGEIVYLFPVEKLEKSTSQTMRRDMFHFTLYKEVLKYVFDRRCFEEKVVDI